MNRKQRLAAAEWIDQNLPTVDDLPAAKIQVPGTPFRICNNPLAAAKVAKKLRAPVSNRNQVIPTARFRDEFTEWEAIDLYGSATEAAKRIRAQLAALGDQIDPKQATGAKDLAYRLEGHAKLP
jgi:hypothetical protein